MPAREAEARVRASLGFGERWILCGRDADRRELEEFSSFSEENPGSILARAAAIDVEAWFDKKRSEVLEVELEGRESALDELEGDWPGEMDGFQLSVHRDLQGGSLLPEVVVAELSIAEPAEIFARFKYGGWNECPEASIHCAIWRRWHEQYGAAVVGLTRDTVEAVVTEPPRTQAAAVALAWEQYLYCADVVDQELGSVSTLAAKIKDRSIWHFWWD